MKNMLFIVCLVMLSITALKGQVLEERYIVHDNEIRKFLLYVPSTYDASTPASLVFIFHGFGSTSENMQGVRFNEQAEIYNYIVAYPQALISPFAYAWNSGTVLNLNIDDLGFTQTMISLLSDEFSINNRRIYSSGYSMGGFMTNRLGCELSTTFAAIASVSGPMSIQTRINCIPERTMSVLYFHGTADDVVDYNGNSLIGTSPASATMDRWSDFNNCEEMRTIEQVPDTANTEYHVEKQYYVDCENDEELIHYKINDWPHRWPLIGSNINATVEIAKFFDRHILPETSIPTTVSNNELPMGMSVGPNPFSNQIDVRLLGNSNNPILNWQLINSKGQVVKSGKQLSSIETKGLSNGLYIYVLLTNEKSYSFNLIKQE